MNLRSILCPVDFSDASRQALRWAIAIAGEWNSRLTVLTAVDPLLSEAARARFALDLVKADVEPALREFVTTTGGSTAAGSANPELVVQIGEASSVVLAAADRLAPDLIVMGTQGLSGFKKLVLGSTAERVLRRATVAVLAVPPADPSAIVSAAGGPRLELTAVLAASDFSDAANRAAQYAAAIAQRLNARLVFAHIVSPLNVPAEFQRYVKGVDEHATKHARALLESQRGDISGSDRAEVVVELGSPADGIASVAREQGAGVIVMGLASEKGTHAVRPGAIVYRVLCQTHVPVLVVPLQTVVSRD